MMRLSASASGRHHAIANRSFAHSYTGKTCRRAQVESPVVFCEGGYTQSTGFWDYNIHKKLFQAYFRAARENVKVRPNPNKESTPSGGGFFIEGVKMERHLHKEMQRYVTSQTTFSDLFEFGNRLITEHGWENLDFLQNLGHSIETKPEYRRFIDRDCQEQLGAVNYFTFEPHIRKRGAHWGFKHENIYYFDESGKINEL